MSGKKTLSLLAALAVGLGAGAASAARSGSTPVAPIRADLAEWTLGFAELELDGGRVTFALVNRGNAPHALTIEGGAAGTAIRINSPILRPGQRATLEVDLPPGEYVAYCPVGGHRGLGMEGRILVRD